MAETTTLYIVRHGQTEWNVAQKMQGHQDSPLTELGVKQAEWLAQALQGEDIDGIYSSSSNRALKTATILRAGRQLPIIKCDELKEINLGSWEGRSQEELKQADPQQFHNFWSDPEQFNASGSESFRAVSERALNKLEHIIGEHSGKRILIVTHTVVLKLLMAHFEQRKLQDLWQLPYIYPACLCKVELSKDSAQILLHGDISHYKELPSPS
jgi:broad specificity phosphatase PhoE